MLDIAVKQAYLADDNFDPRRQAISREYSYYILNSRNRAPLKEGLTYRVSGRLDIRAMNMAASVLIGVHDFSSFASSLDKDIKSTVRRMERARVRREGELVVVDMVANAFLPHQVRNTVGTLIRVGLGRMGITEFESIMDAGIPGLAGPAAPAEGLYLEKVNYPHPFKEEIDEEFLKNSTP